MLKKLMTAASMSTICCTASAQNIAAGKRSFGLQVGVAGSSYTLDYNDGREEGFAVYADVDLNKHLGVEAVYRNASIQTPHDIGENHALIGPRITVRRGRFIPYAKALIGAGTINFQQGYFSSASSQSYLTYALGAGIDFHLSRHLNIRALDFEYQRWPNFPPHGLTPTGFSVGAAYVF